MILTERAEHLFNELIKIVPGNQVDEHLLLRAFLTVKFSAEMDTEVFKEYLLESPLNSEDNLWQEIDTYNLEDYLRYVAAYEVADLKAFLYTRDRANQHISEKDLLLALLIVKKQEPDSVLAFKTEKRKLKDQYVAEASRLGIGHIEDTGGEFGDFLNSIYSYHLDPDSTSLRLKKYGGEKTERHVKEIVRVLYDVFNKTRSEAYNICSEIRNRNPRQKNEITRILQDLIPLEKDSDNKDVYSLANSLFEVDGELEWYELACGLYISQRRFIYLRSDKPGTTKTKELSNDVERPNDVALELSFLYPLFFQNKHIDSNRFLVVFPSPFLIHRIIGDKDLEAFNVTFMMADAGQETMTKAWVFDPRQSTIKLNRLFEHVTIEHYKNNFEDSNGVSFRSIDSSGYTDILIEDLHFSSNDTRCREGIMSIIRTADKRSRIICLCRDSDMHGPTSLFPLVPKESIRGVFVIPTRMTGTRQKKNVWIADLNENKPVEDDVEIEIYSFEKSRYDNPLKRMFLDQCRPTVLSYLQYMHGSEPIRKSLKKEKPDTPDDKKRNKPRYIQFCPEIAFKYSVFSKPGKLESEYYVLHFVDGGKQYGKRSNFAAKSFSEFQFWCMNEYIYEKVRINAGTRKKENAGDIKPEANQPAEDERTADSYGKRGEMYAHWIRDVIGKQYNRKNITLRAFWCFHPEIKTELKLSDDGYLILKNLVHSDLGLEYLAGISGEVVSDFLSGSEVFDDIDDSYIIGLLSRILALAVKEGNIVHNWLSDDDGEDYSSDGAARSALARRTLPEDKFRELFDKLNPKDNEIVKPVNLALLLRMLTGITTPEAAALRWSDFRETKQKTMRFHYLMVSKRVVPGEVEPQYNSRETSFRLIPLGRRLGEILKELKQSLEGDDIEDRFILENENGSRISPKMISKTFLKYFDELKTDEIRIRIPKGDSVDYSDVLLTRSFGDLLRENFRYWAMKVAGFNTDEISALFGNSRTSTGGKYYFAYNFEISLLFTQVKINRLEAFLLHGGNRDRFEERRMESSPMTIAYDTFSPIRIDIQYDAKIGEGKKPIEVGNTYGAEVTEMKQFSSRRG